MGPRSAPRRGRPVDLAAGLASPFLDSELFQEETEPGQDARLAALQEVNAFRLGVEGDAREDLERRARYEGPDTEHVESEIIGTNDMDAVANSLAIPYRWICRLEIDYEITPFGTAQRLTGAGRGTGTLISPCHVLTAAHNLAEYDPVRKNTLRATRIRVTPAHDGSSSPPVATVEADLSRSRRHRLWDITRRYDATGGPDNAGEVETNRYDYALLTLRSAIGDSQVRALGGPLGYWGTQGSGGAARFQRLEPAVLRSHAVFVAGYAVDDCVQAARTARANPDIRLGSQLTATGQITLIMEGGATQYVGRSMAHDVDTCAGQSGAPVALELDGIYYLVGVHTGGAALTSGGRTNHAVRLTMEVSTQVSDWMTATPCSAAARELEDGGSLAGERLAVVEEDLAPDSLDRGGEDETEDGGAGEAPAEWAMEWADAEGESPLSTAGAEESEEDTALEYETPPMTQAISDAVDQKDWPRVLELAMQVGWHDENQLTNLLFFSRHPELDRRKLDPKKNKQDQKLADEWNQILVKEVRPAIERAAEDSTLEVSGRLVAERDPELSGEKGEKFKEVVAWAAREVNLDPGFLAAVLLAEVGRAAPYLRSGEVSSFFTGTDDFFAQRGQLRANVPAFAQVHFDEKKVTTSINEHGRAVTTIPYRTGKDAALATAVYLKWGEIKLSRAMRKNGRDFEALPVATRFVLVRIAMAAGHGGISPDGDLIRFKKKGDKLVKAQPGEAGGILLGVARSLDRVLKSEDILVRNWEPRKDPTNDSHITHRNATILASQAIHLGDWFFGAPALGIQPELGG
jgi:V8-like Glu-specific endopeptidase